MCRLDRSRSVEKSLIPRNTGAEKQAPTCMTVLFIYYYCRREAYITVQTVLWQKRTIQMS